MTWEYISGIFDGEGTITITKNSRNKLPTPIFEICNNELRILTEIQQFILNEINIKGFISKKKPRKPTHQINYTLKYTNCNKVSKILEHLNSLHTKKRLRIIFILSEYVPLVKRNGKYSATDLDKIREKLNNFFLLVS